MSGPAQESSPAEETTSGPDLSADAHGIDAVRREPFGDNPQVGARGASTQRSILAAALGVFAEHGFHDTRVELITEVAGCSRPAFYQYFSSKEDVFWRLAGHLARELARLVDELPELTPDADGVAALAVWLDELIDVYAAYQPVFIAFPAAFRDQHRPLPHTLATRLRRSIDGGDALGIDPGTLAEATVIMLLRSIHYWLLGLVGVARPRFTASLGATVHRALFGPLAANAPPLVDPAPRAVPGWPEVPADGEGGLRPRGLATRRSLLDAAGRVLPRRGYHAIRVDDVAAEAGVSHGSFYRYFESKDALFRVLALEAGSRMAELVDAFPTESTDDLHAWLGEWFATYRSNGGVISAWQEIGYEDPDLGAMSIDLALVFFDRLQRVVQTRGFGDTTVDAGALLSVIEHVPYTVLVLGSLDEDTATAAAADLIRRALLAPL